MQKSKLVTLVGAAIALGGCTAAFMVTTKTLFGTLESVNDVVIKRCLGKPHSIRKVHNGTLWTYYYRGHKVKQFVHKNGVKVSGEHHYIFTKGCYLKLLMKRDRVKQVQWIANNNKGEWKYSYQCRAAMKHAIKCVDREKRRVKGGYKLIDLNM